MLREGERGRLRPLLGGGAPLVLLLLAVAAPCRGAGGGSADSLLWRADRARVELTVADSLFLSLGARWVRPGSLVLSHGDSTLVRGADYLLDAKGGRVRLLRGFPKGTRLEARFERFPVPLRSEYRKHRARSGAPGDDVASGPRGPESVVWPRETARLAIQGTKTFAVEVGSQRDLSLKQSLDLAVHGQVTRDVEVRAILTDRQTPLQPQGTSAELQDFDRVLMEVEGPRARMTLGDFNLVAPPARFARMERQLEGALGRVTPDQGSVFAAFATSPGSFESREFMGEEGRQGPYPLAGSTALGASLVVAGSEKVWLDGERMSRGEAADYVVDYARGTLTFTARRVIGSYSRIAVDYQLATERYRRGVAAIGAGWEGASDSSRVQVTWLSEGDDRHRLRSGSLSAADKESLRAAGDSLTEALRSGVEYMGPGAGEYDSVQNDTLATPFFLYRGPGAGSYRVRFVRAEVGEGDYADTTDAEGAPYWIYRGRKRADWLPGREVPRPEKTSIVTLAGRAPPILGLRLSGELALSDHDRNTWSPLHDGDNTGSATLLALTTAPIAAGPARIRLGGTLHQVGARFETLDRSDPAFFGLDWSVDPLRLESGDRRSMLDAAIEIYGQRVDLEAGALDNLRDLEARRGSVSGTGQAGPFRWRGRWLETESRDRAGETMKEGGRSVREASLGWPGSRVETSVRYRRESNEAGRDSTRSGDTFDEVGVRIGTGRAVGRVHASLAWTGRETRALEGDREPVRDRGTTREAELEWLGAGGGTVGAQYAERRFDPTRGGTKRRNSVGRIFWRGRGWREALSQDGRFEITTLAVTERMKEVRYVGPGLGHYDAFGVYQGVGDYEVEYRESADKRPLERLDSAIRLELDLTKLRRDGGPRLGVLRTLRATQVWNTRVDTGHGAGWIWPRLLPILAGRRDLARVELDLRTDLSMFPGSRFLSPRFRFESRRMERRESTGLWETQSTTLHALRLRSRPAARWSLDLEPERALDALDLSFAGGGANGGKTGWKTKRVRVDQEFSIRSGLILGLDCSVEDRDRIGADERARVWEGTPFGAWTPPPAPRSRVELRTTRTSSARTGASGRADRSLARSGWTTRLVSSIRLRSSFDLSLWVEERRPDRGTVVRTARTELRASF